jgi:gluconolactonase
MRTSVVVCAAVLAASIGCKQSEPVPAENAAAAAPAPTSSMRIDRLDPALDKLIAPDTKIDKVATGFQFTEGPMWRDGRLWFSDLVGNRMYAVSPDGKIELLIDHSGGLENPPKGYKGSNAMVTDKDGSVLMCQHALRRIARLDDKLKQTVFLDKFQGKKFNSPNDLVFAPDGSLWFTDPPYGLDKGNDDPSKEIPFNGVYRYVKGKLTAVIKDLKNPNGIGFSPDGKILYVANSGPKMYINRYDVKPDGTLGAPAVLISYPDQPNNEVPDGLKIDAAGNVWTSGPGGIRIITPQGKVLGQIKLPEVAANLAWANDGHTLYITGSTSIYRFNVASPGQMPLYTK